MAKPPYLVAFDTETTGVDTEAARIVSAYVGVYDTQADAFVEEWDWLIDPGVEIPEGAAEVHGITTEYAREWGAEASDAVYSILQRLDILQRRGLPFVVMNARYDFTLLDREVRRHYAGLRPWRPSLVLDPYVLDKHSAPYRRGKRTLVATCAALGVPVEANVHDAAADCLMAARLASRLLTHPSLARYSLEELHAQQVKWAAEQARGLAAYFRKSGKPDAAASIREPWPLVPHPDDLETEA